MPSTMLPLTSIAPNATDTLVPVGALAVGDVIEYAPGAGFRRLLARQPLDADTIVLKVQTPTGLEFTLTTAPDALVYLKAGNTVAHFPNPCPLMAESVVSVAIH